MKSNVNILRVMMVVLLFCTATVRAQIPAGYYYRAQDKTKAELKTALKELAYPQQLMRYGGGDVQTSWFGFYQTDRKSDNTVYDMYSGIVRYFNMYNGVSGMHIEHSLPKSWWGGWENDAYKDLFHLYPSDGTTNSTKNNFPLGEVGTATFDNGVSKVGKNTFGTVYTDNCFEPADEYKGDFARSYLYISTVYEHYAPWWNSPMMNNNTYPVWKPWAKDLLLKWHRQDPVSNKEIARNDSIYKLQGNRNPYIDYPALAEHIWGSDTLQSYPFPQETEPFLLSPLRGTVIDFGVLMQNDSREVSFTLQGVNIADTLHLSFSQQAAFTVDKKAISSAIAINGTEITVRFNPAMVGLLRDTLTISGSGISERITLSGLASADFMLIEPDIITPVGAELKWISHPNADDYKLTLYQGDQLAGDLIISTYVEGSSFNKAIELYNGTGETIDLSRYSLQKQSNGSGSFQWNLQLSGSLPDGGHYVLVHKSCTNTDLLAYADTLTEDVLNFNGNDAIALLHSGVTIDIVGFADAGAQNIWGENKTLQRKTHITHPTRNYNPSEWSDYLIDTFDVLKRHAMNFASSTEILINSLSVGNVSSYTIDNLTPETSYSYKIEASQGQSKIPAINTMQFTTHGLEAPVVMEALHVNTNGFTANWEETLYAKGYLLDVFTITGDDDITETEGFSGVGSNGKPLPADWTGTASGNYTSTASSGVEIPSISLKNNGEWLLSKTYENPIGQLRFMYRFASASTGSSLVIDGIGGTNTYRIDSIPYTNTTKTNPIYTLNRNNDIRNIRFTYNKIGSGNLALDDVEVTYGNQDTVYIWKNELIATNEITLQELNENAVYYYQVKATRDGSVSPLSETAKTTTLLSSAVQQTEVQRYSIFNSNNNVIIKGLNGEETISIYTVDGLCLYRNKNNTSITEIPLNQKGVFIVLIQHKDINFATKILK